MTGPLPGQAAARCFGAASAACAPPIRRTLIAASHRDRFPDAADVSALPPSRCDVEGGAGWGTPNDTSATPLRCLRCPGIFRAALSNRCTREIIHGVATESDWYCLRPNTVSYPGRWIHSSGSIGIVSEKGWPEGSLSGPRGYARPRRHHPRPHVPAFVRAAATCRGPIVWCGVMPVM